MKLSKILMTLLIATTLMGCRAINHAKAARELKEGMVAYQSGKSGLAVQKFNSAAEMDKDYAEPPYYLGQLYHQSMNEPEKAIPFYKMANDRAPENPQILYALGAALADANQVNEAVSALEKSVELKPDFARAWFRLGNAKLARKDYAGAVDAYMSSIKADPEMLMSNDDPGGNAFHALGSLYQDFDFNDKALKVYEEGLRANPNSVRLMVGVGGAALLNRDYEKAERAFADALEKEPGNSFALFNRGVALMGLDRKDAAARSFETFVKSGAGSPEQTAAANVFVRQLKQARAN